ncbi:MAG: M14 metallopeptidase family protein [Cyclobacteriaceae bacterium]
MKYLSIFLLLLIYQGNVAYAQLSLLDYLPDNVQYDPNIPTPKEVLGFEVGEWHMSHDQLSYYLYTLENSSTRIKLEKTGRTFEHRPLLLLTVSSVNNLANLTDIQEKHTLLKHPEAADTINIDNLPAVAWLAYSIHGNEMSGSHAAVLMAYYLAAAQGPSIDSLLTNTIILIDPCMNPDGMQRFTSWVNQHRGSNLIASPESREHNEPWPRGRSNHYWFDLNRDWLAATQPETEQRLKTFHDWYPNVFADFHEMGSKDTYFFQPGIPSRNHPLTPKSTAELCEKIAAYHAKAFDKEKLLYFTKESFDDFFFGKSSTYPDLHGGIGILFEQASSRGHLMETLHGEMPFSFTIRNQLTTSISTLKAVQELRKELLMHKVNFYKESLSLASKDASKAFIFGSQHDTYKSHHLAETLMKHRVQLYRSLKDLKVEDKNFKASSSYIIPLNQPQYRLIRAFFDRDTKFQDSLFYDISAWTFDLAYNLDFEKLNARNVPSDLIGERVDSIKYQKGTLEWKSNYGYAIQWQDYFAPAAIYQLQKNGVVLNAATKSFSDNRGNAFRPGTMVIPLGIQQLKGEEIYALLEKVVEKYGINVTPIETGGQISQGVNIGSPSFLNLRKPNIALITGEGVSAYEAGEIWHLLDKRFGMNVSLISVEQLGKLNLSRYNTILMADGNYGQIDAQFAMNLKTWVQQGGLIVAQKKAVQWLVGLGLSNAKISEEKSDTSTTLRYSDLEASKGRNLIGGAIFKVKLDLTHPITYGYFKDEISVFRNHKIFFSKSNQSVANPIQYTANPLMAGYVSKENLEQIKNSYGVSIASYGQGRVIGFADNHNFRAFWKGTNRLFINAIFLGSEMKTQ